MKTNSSYSNLDYSESNIALNLLSRIDLNSKGADSEISDLITNKLIVPYILTMIPKGFYLYRARINETNISFTRREEISYNRDTNKIRLGRANLPEQSIFYASHKWETPLLETSPLLTQGIKNGIETFTIGRWLVEESFPLFALIPNLELLDENIEFFKNYRNLLENDPELNNPHAKNHLQFFSDQFSIQAKGNENLYKISSAYFNHVITNSKERVLGMLYPTVEYYFKDLNVALLPEAVDRFLTLDMVVKYELSIKDGIGDYKMKEIPNIKTFQC
jgi:hypothetical protein